MHTPSRIRLLLGLGNPGEKYAQTRHNAGYLALQRLAEVHGWTFKQDKRFLGQVAKGQIDGVTIYLVLPETYMNESGRSLRKALDFFKLSVEEVLVVLDDIHLPFGTLRLRKQGGTGGHNGLKSIQAHLGSDAYLRLRVGIGQQKGDDLTKHVLGRFSREESEELGLSLDRAAKLIERIVQGEPLSQVMNEVNRKMSQEKIDNKNSSSDVLGDC
ncbi:MAG: aminoacyl-tRNA hydrolase [Waddliaceae bacterium]|nr:aminoacyl-tRNA hydrolase [Waddliaceae bacterium]